MVTESILKSPPVSSFPLMAWNFTTWNRYLDVPAYLRSARECGLTIAGFVRPSELDACEKAGVQALVYDERLSTHDWRKVTPQSVRKSIAEVVKEVSGHPALFGYYLKDEPSAEEFEGLAAASSVVKELNPGVWPYINLFPNYASTEQLGTATYEEHLERFFTVCQPPVVSYDHYALMEDGTLKEAYFTNLEQIRSASAKHGVPFVNIVQSVALIHHREPSAADYRFQAYTTLAYGASGITYFTFLAPHVGNFRGSPIDHFGNRTPAFAALQNVNYQVARLSGVLRHLRHDGVYHLGNVPQGCRARPDNSLIEAEGNFVAGEFTHSDGSRYVLIVNPDMGRSTGCNPTARGKTGGLKMVSPYTGELTPYEGEQCYLAPGQGVLLRLP